MAEPCEQEVVDAAAGGKARLRGGIIAQAMAEGDLAALGQRAGLRR